MGLGVGSGSSGGAGCSAGGASVGALQALTSITPITRTSNNIRFILLGLHPPSSFALALGGGEAGQAHTI